MLFFHITNTYLLKKDLNVTPKVVPITPLAKDRVPVKSVLLPKRGIAKNIF